MAVLLLPLLIPIFAEIQTLFENQSYPHPCVLLVQDLCPSGFSVRTGVPLGLHLSLHLALHWQECHQPYTIRDGSKAALCMTQPRACPGDHREVCPASHSKVLPGFGQSPGLRFGPLLVTDTFVRRTVTLVQLSVALFSLQVWTCSLLYADPSKSLVTHCFKGKGV